LKQEKGGDYGKIFDSQSGKEERKEPMKTETEGHGKTSRVPAGPGLQQGPICKEGWLGRKERLAGRVSCLEGWVQKDGFEWRQKAHGGAFCTTCKLTLMEEMGVDWDGREGLHDRIPCTRTKMDGQGDYSRSEAQKALTFALDLEEVKEGQQEQEEEPQTDRTQRKHEEFNRLFGRDRLPEARDP
jgi:hypothetical protein